MGVPSVGGARKGGGGDEAFLIYVVFCYAERLIIDAIPATNHRLRRYGIRESNARHEFGFGAAPETSRQSVHSGEGQTATRVELGRIDLRDRVLLVILQNLRPDWHRGRAVE